MSGRAGEDMAQGLMLNLRRRWYITDEGAACRFTQNPSVTWSDFMRGRRGEDGARGGHFHPELLELSKYFLPTR